MKRKLKFFWFVLNRALSGVVNGLFYAHSSLLWPVMALFMIYTGYGLVKDLVYNWCDLPTYQRILSILGIIGSLTSIMFLGFAFKNRKLDIHFWTFATQTSISGTQTITNRKWWKNLWWQLLAVSPSAFLQKVFINIIPGGKWSYSGTNDATGKTWGMKLFGKQIKVPRLGNMKVKLLIAVLCVGTFLVVDYIKVKKQKQHEKIEYKKKRICA